MKGMKLAIVFSSLLFSIYAEDVSNLICSKTYFPDDEGTMPSVTGDDSYSDSDDDRSQTEKKWTPDSDEDNTTGTSSLLVPIPKADKEFFPDED